VSGNTVITSTLRFARSIKLIWSRKEKFLYWPTIPKVRVRLRVRVSRSRVSRFMVSGLKLRVSRVRASEIVERS